MLGGYAAGGCADVPVAAGPVLLAVWCKVDRPVVYEVVHRVLVQAHTVGACLAHVRSLICFPAQVIANVATCTISAAIHLIAAIGALCTPRPQLLLHDDDRGDLLGMSRHSVALQLVVVQRREVLLEDGHHDPLSALAARHRLDGRLESRADPLAARTLDHMHLRWRGWTW